MVGAPKNENWVGALRNSTPCYPPVTPLRVRVRKPGNTTYEIPVAQKRVSREIPWIGLKIQSENHMRGTDLLGEIP